MKRGRRPHLHTARPEAEITVADLGAQTVGSTPTDFAPYLKKEDAKWGEVVRKGNIKLD